jgi:hypothetical protein
MKLYEVWIKGIYYGTVIDELTHSYVSQLVDSKILTFIPNVDNIDFRLKMIVTQHYSSNTNGVVEHSIGL